MHTPEPRHRISGGATATAPSTGFLRRGDVSTTQLQQHHQLAAGPSISLDEEGGVVTALDTSPQPSQFTQLQQQRLTRQRPRFHTVQDLDLALNPAIEGKINSRNAWASKEASDLLEGMTHTIETTLDASAADDYSGFTKAATVVEGCSKVWTSRVDSTYLRSNLMVQRLLRNEGSTAKNGDTVDGNEGEEGEEAGESGDGLSRGQKKSRSRATSRAVARTLAIDVTEINLDSKAKTMLTQTGVNAQFRAITEKFDQGNAQGLLMNNAPMGRSGNIILDVDYAVTSGDAVERHSGGSGVRRASEGGSEGPPPTGQTSLVEYDTAIHASVADLPPYTGLTSSLAAVASQRSSQHTTRRGSAALSRGTNSTTSLLSTGHSEAIPADSPLIIPFAAMKAEEEPAGYPSEGLHGEDDKDDAVDAEDFSMDYGGTAYDDDNYDGDDNAPDGDVSALRQASGTVASLSATGGGGAGLSVVNSSGDLGLEARLLVSGAAEINAMEALLIGRTQLALEAEDPTSWCPLSDVPTHPLAAAASNTELSRLHREHRFITSSQRGAGSDAGAGGRNGAGTMTTAAAKRAKKERAVVFQLPSEASSELSTTFSTAVDSAAQEMSAVLKQSSTVARNMTPFGKQVVIAKDAPQTVLNYTQSAFQRSKAEQNGLVLPEDPLPGKTLPAYLPYPLHTQQFFQPFSTALLQWNLLRKSASGHLLHSSVNEDAGDGRGPVGVSLNRISAMHPSSTGPFGEESEATTTRQEDMPVEYFPGGAETGDGDDGDDDTGGYADFADMYGPDDSNGADGLEEDRLLQVGLRASADAHLLAGLHASTGAASALSAAPSSGRSSSVFSTDPAELLKVLMPPETTVPNQVDVVKLRQLMWEALQAQWGGVVQLDGEASTNVDGAMLDNAAPGPTTHDDGAVMDRGVALKATVRTALERARKRSRADAEEEDSSATMAAASVAVSSGLGSVAVGTGLAPSDGLADPLRHNVAFVDVARAMLPHIPLVSSTGTLSPAFFFFTILFLTNEQNLVLRSVESLDDLLICGVAGCRK